MTGQRDCPDTLASKRVSDLTDAQLFGLRHSWLAAHLALRFMKLRIESNSLSKHDRQMLDTPLFDLVRYHQMHVGA